MLTHYQPKHVYVHIPFCQTRCAYCDFNTFANREDSMQRYVRALTRQIRAMGTGDWAPAGGWHHPEVAPYVVRDIQGPLSQTDLPYTVFLGGGTPTALPIELFAEVMQAIGDIIPLEQAEVTTEANPGTVLDANYLKTVRELGVNRLSMGVQTLDDQMLKVLGRIHTAEEAFQSYQAARAVGFENINLDFIFGLPGQTIQGWKKALHEIVKWDVDHFALYSLIVEPGTPLAAHVAAGRITVPNDDHTAEMYEHAIDILGTAGYVQYEISNWARPQQPLEACSALPAYASRHNIAYWLNAEYLGCGAGAHSHTQQERWADIRSIDGYCEAIEADRPPIAERTPLDITDIAAETMMMGLRLNTGVGSAHFQDQTGTTLEAMYSDIIHDLQTKNLIEQTPHALQLTERGRMIGNSVFAAFL